MASEGNAALVRSFYAAMSRGDRDGLMAVWNDDPLWHGPGLGDIRGREAMRQLVEQFLGAFPDLHESVEDVIAEGDKVVCRLRSRGTHRGDLMGVPPTGKQIDISSITIFRCADGKIAEEWDQTDFLGMMQQLGVIPAPRQ